MPSKLGHYIFYYVFMPRLQVFIVVGNRSLFFSFCHCEFFSPLSLRGNEVAEAISSVFSLSLRRFSLFLSLRGARFLSCHCESSPIINGRDEAISSVIGHFRDYFVVWFFTRTDGIASPAFGGLAMTEGVRGARNDF